LYQLKIAAPQPAVKPRKTEKKKLAEPAPDSLRMALLDLQKRGFNRLYQDGAVHEFISPESLLDLDFKKPVYVLVDRLAVSGEAKSRLTDSVEICYREGHGEAVVQFVADSNSGVAERMNFNERFECKNDGTIYQDPEPRLFSFNNPYGACPRCQGFGNTIDFDLNLVVPDARQIAGRWRDRAVDQTAFPSTAERSENVGEIAGIPTNVPWRHLKKSSGSGFWKAMRKTTTKGKGFSRGWSARNISCTCAFF
jgi:excinuclease ABC subunit A